MGKTKDHPFLETIDLRESDVQWVCNAIGGRHTGGYKAWWAQNAGKFSMEDVVEAALTIWEAGRSKARRHPLSKAQRKLRLKTASSRR